MPLHPCQHSFILQLLLKTALLLLSLRLVSSFSRPGGLKHDSSHTSSNFDHNVDAALSTKQDSSLAMIATTSRRGFIMQSSKKMLAVVTAGMSTGGVTTARAEEDDFFEDEEIRELYENPAIPPAPEERSGLVVLRVAEVAQFQEKILRAIASGEVEDVKVAPLQFVFGNQILLKNSNLDGNMKLMIYEEIPKSKRNAAIKNAVVTMNTLQDISKYAASIQRDFETQEMVELADMYRSVRINLNQLYEYLPQKEKDKYYGYFVAVTEYEKKIAEGTYNPELDGVLRFDDD